MKENEIFHCFMNKNFKIRFFVFAFFLLALLAFLSFWSSVKIPGKCISFMAASLVLLLSSFLVILKAKDDFFPMAFSLAAIGIFYFVVCPFEMPPDENAHFFRAFEISLGRFFSRPLSWNAFGDILPSAVVDCWNRASLIDWEKTREVGFSNTALYSVVNYLPQSLGIFAARIFTRKVFVIYYAGRLFNFLASLSLSIFALKKIPFGRKVLFVIMLFPMTLQEMISMAPDAFVNALSFAIFAFSLNLAYKKENVSRKESIFLGMLILMVSLCKLVYLPLLFIVYIIPSGKMRRADFVILKILVPVLALSLNLSSLALSSKILAESKLGEQNAGEQIHFILSNPLYFLKVFIRTVISQSKGYVFGCIGFYLGWLNIRLPVALCGLFAVILFFEAFCQNNIHFKARKLDIFFFLIIFVMVFGLILTSEYVGWSAPKASKISGVQGRYFIPVVSFLLFPFLYRKHFGIIRNSRINGAENKMSSEEKTESEGKISCKEKSLLLITILLFLNLTALIYVLKFFIEKK